MSYSFSQWIHRNLNVFEDWWFDEELGWLEYCSLGTPTGDPSVMMITVDRIIPSVHAKVRMEAYPRMTNEGDSNAQQHGKGISSDH